MLGCLRNDEDVAKELVSRGASVNICDKVNAPHYFVTAVRLSVRTHTRWVPSDGHQTLTSAKITCYTLALLPAGRMETQRCTWLRRKALRLLSRTYFLTARKSTGETM